MRPAPEFQYDVACATSQGRRDYQEDAVVADFPLGTEQGFAVLSDGMGGHAAGDVASKIIVTEVFSELKLQTGDPENFEENVRAILVDAAFVANQCISGHVQANPDTDGMGATLVVPVVLKNRLFWISIGDSPLFLFRDGGLKQLNEDHSMALQIDFMVETGLIGAEHGKNHPDRNCLTSVLVGGEIARIDCPCDPLELQAGDIVIAASDGLQTLSDDEIESSLRDLDEKPSAEIAAMLLHKVDRMADPDQDNVSFSVIRINPAARLDDADMAVPALLLQPANRVPVMPQLVHGGAAASVGAAMLGALRFLRRAHDKRDGTA